MTSWWYANCITPVWFTRRERIAKDVWNYQITLSLHECKEGRIHMTRATAKHLGVVGLLTAALLTISSCSSGDESVRGGAIAVDQTTQALLIGDLESANGSYGALCSHRTGAWSVEIKAGAILDHPPLSVLLNDTSCVLTLTSLRTTLGGNMAATPALVLTSSFQIAASTFGVPVEFYANARLSAVTFASDFVLHVLFSDDPNLATASNTAEFIVVVATATAGAVAAPDYTLNAAGLLVRTDVNNVVQTVTGTADLTAGTVVGQTYVVVDAAGLNTYAAIDAAYHAGTIKALVLAIPADDFTLVGKDLTVPEVRTLIIANTQDGFTSYQAFEITFNPAP